MIFFFLNFFHDFCVVKLSWEYVVELFLLLENQKKKKIKVKDFTKCCRPSL